MVADFLVNFSPGKRGFDFVTETSPHSSHRGSHKKQRNLSPRAHSGGNLTIPNNPLPALRLKSPQIAFIFPLCFKEDFEAHPNLISFKNLKSLAMTSELGSPALTIYRSLSAPPGPEPPKKSEKHLPGPPAQGRPESLEKVSKKARESQKSPGRVPKRLFRDFFQTLGRFLGRRPQRLFSDFFGASGPDNEAQVQIGKPHHLKPPRLPGPHAGPQKRLRLKVCARLKRYTMLPRPICRNVLEDFCCINFGGFSPGFSWRIFLGTFSHKNEEKTSGEKIREKIRRLENKNPRKIRSAESRP